MCQCHHRSLQRSSDIPSILARFGTYWHQIPPFLSSTSTPIWIVDVPSYFVRYYVDLHCYSDIIYNHIELTVHSIVFGRLH
jgi:hypothetical protein